MNVKIISVVVLILVLSIGVGSATWCDTDFAKRIDVNVNNTAGSTLTDYQVYVNLTTNPINETSLRVYNITDCTLRPQWYEETSSGNCTKLWINYSAVAASSWTNDTAIYYDNAAASSTSNGTTTFEFFDGFEDGDISDWTQENTAIGELYASAVPKHGTYSGGYDDKSGAGWGRTYKTIPELREQDKVIEWYWRVSSITPGGERHVLGFAPVATTYPNLIYLYSFEDDWKYSAGTIETSTVVVDTWYSFMMKVDTSGDDSTFDLWINGTKKVTAGDTHGTVNSVDNFVFYNNDNNGFEYVDDIRVRKYSVPEPSAILGSEEVPATTPAISNVQNGSISSTSQYINWTVNQSASNRVLYSNESDLTPAWYSIWDNSTAAPNITLSALTASTQYWYQAWTYNTINNSLSDNSSTLSFTTTQAYIPPNPTNLQNTSGNYWVNYTWDTGTPGNLTDTYNVSWNSAWYNETTNTFMQKDVWAENWANITIYAYNASGELSLGAISDQIQLPPASWCDADFAKRIDVSVNNTAGSALTNYQVYVDLSANPINETSMRVYNSSDCTLRPHWCENETSGNCYALWINYSAIGTSSWTNNTGVYYDSATASSASNGTTTFEFFDDFEENIATVGDWQNKTSITHPSADLSCIPYNNKLYCFGGYGTTASDVLNYTQVYDPSTNVWTQKEPMPTKRWGMIAVEYNGNVTVFGGEGGAFPSHISTVERYNISTDTWITMNDCPAVIGAHGIMGVEYNGKIYLVETEDCYEYTPSTDTYIQKASLPSGLGKAWGTAAVYEDKMYIIGGGLGAGACTGTVFVYNITTNVWDTTTKTSMPNNQKRWGATRENPILDDKIYVTHGLYSTTFYSTCYEYNISTDSWTTMTSASHKRDGVACGFINGKLHVVGGRNVSSNPFGVNYNEEFDPSSGDTPILDTNKWYLNDTSDTIAQSAITYQGVGALKHQNGVGYPLCLAKLISIEEGVIEFEGRYDYVGNPHLFTFYPTSVTSPDYPDHYFFSYTYTSTPGISVYNDGSTGITENQWEHYQINFKKFGTSPYLRNRVFLNIAEITSDWVGTNDYANWASGDAVKFAGFMAANVNTDVIYVDNFRVRKYTSSEPSSTLGNEEEQGANPTLHIDNTINLKEDWGRTFSSNLSANVTAANASDTWMNFSNAEFTNTSLGWLNLTLDEWVNESHNVNAPVTNVSVTMFLNGSGATNDSDSFYYEITKRTNTATMDSSATQNADTSETFYINGTCNEEYSETFLGAADLLEDGAIVDTNSSVTDYINFSHSESSAGQYNYTILFYNLTHYDNGTTATYSNVTVYDVMYEPPNPTNLQNITGNFWINHTWSAGTPGNVTDSFNVSVFPGWYNTTLTTYYNDTGLTPHDWSNVTVWAYNSSGNGSLSVGNVSDDVQIPNNLPVLSGLPDNTTTEDINQTDIFDLDSYFSDVDSDTPTFLIESNNESAYVSVTINASNNVSYTLASGWNGTASVVINATDGWGGEDSDTFLIIVNAAAGPGDYIPDDPTTLTNTTSNYWVNYTWNVGSGGNVTNSYNVSWNLSWYNTTTNTFMKKEVGASNWANITVYAYNNSGNGSLSAGSISDNVQAPAFVPGDYVPPNPTTLANITGNYYVNYTWIVGVPGNITDSYNVSWNLSWYNTTLTTYMQKEVGASNWANITVYAFNSSGNGTLSSGSLSDETQAPAYVPGDYIPATPTTLANTTGNYYVNFTWSSGGGANVTDSYNVSWNTTWYNTTLTTYMQKEVGASNWGNISVYAYNSSGNGSLSGSYITDNVQAPAYVPSDYIPSNPTTLQNTTGNYYVNYTWIAGGGVNITDSYNVSWNLTWYNNTLTAYMQKEVGAEGWANITVYAYNSSGSGSLSTGYISDEVQAPAAAPVDYPPATPTTLANTTGNGWVHYTWSSGGGANITDSYNVSWNLTWYNTTLVAYMNDTVGEFGWANISVWAYNSSNNGSLSVGSVSDNTQASGGTFTTSMTTTVYNLITYYGSSTSTAEQFGLNIGGVDYVAMYNGSFYSHTMGFVANNFTIYHGISYYVYLNATGSSTYQRNNISDTPYNTQLYNRWNTIGWTNATDTNAEGIANSIGSACKYTSSLNADGITYTTHTVGFASNNHGVTKGKGYWVWVNTGLSWARNS